NAVWVKNEWSRFLKLIASGEKKTLIPCYKGIDAYDMPKEFAKLQAQDMGRVGAVQDLLRGIGKILPKEAPAAEPVTRQPSAMGGALDSEGARLNQRGYMALEDGDYSEAERFFERALDANPNEAQAYLGKLLAHRQLSSIEQLMTIADSNIGDVREFKRAEQFADSELGAKLKQIREKCGKNAQMIRLAGILEKYYTNKVQTEPVRDVYLQLLSQNDDRERRAGKLVDQVALFGPEMKEKADELVSRWDLVIAIGNILRDCKYHPYEELRIMPIVTEANRYASMDVYDTLKDMLRVKAIERTSQGFSMIISPEERQRIEEENRQKEEQEKKAQEELRKKTEESRELADRERDRLLKDYEEAAKEYDAHNTLLTREKETLVSTEKKLAAMQKDLEGEEEELTNLRGLFTGKRKAELHEIIEEKKRMLRQVTDKAERGRDMVRRLTESMPEAASREELLYRIADNYLQYDLLDDAAEYLIQIPQYGDVQQKTGNDPKLQKAVEEAQARKQEEEKRRKTEMELAVREAQEKKMVALRIPGSEITYGKYRQDSVGDEKKPIKWIVLACRDNQSLVISKYGLDVQPFLNKIEKKSWSTSDLRQWLNSSFYCAAFSGQEMKCIAETTVNCSNIWGGNETTKDRVFLLSSSEAEVYFRGKPELLPCKPTPYAVSRGAYTDLTGHGTWRFRSQKKNDYMELEGIQPDGSQAVYYTNAKSGCVRPAMWLDLKVMMMQ
ncbi:MAG: DUF6273 domain-containing protein, partial [Clostridiales bacterium]|nr:DUF6273 domain-containing protein [Clostridiales bacterium]